MSINGFDITWMGNQVRAEGLDHQHFCMFEVSADQSRIVQRGDSSSFVDDDSEDAKQFIRDAGKAVEEFLRRLRGGT
jgi:hypothetical protein